MVKRTEEDKILQTAIKVKLGGRDYKIRPLVIKYSRPWRKNVGDLMSNVPKYTQMDTDNPEEFGKALKLLMGESQDKVIDLFFEYARELNRGEIEETATEAEIAKAFEAVLNLAFPLGESLPVSAMKAKKPSR